MRINKIFVPPHRRIGEGVLMFTERCRIARKRYEEMKADSVNLERNEFAKKYFPNMPVL